MEEKKIVKKNVTFSPTDEKHTMVHWSFAYREARKGTWHLFAIDRCRFKRRISQFEEKLKPHLTKRIQEASYNTIRREIEAPLDEKNPRSSSHELHEAEPSTVNDNACTAPSSANLSRGVSVKQPSNIF